MTTPNGASMVRFPRRSGPRSSFSRALYYFAEDSAAGVWVRSARPGPPSPLASPVDRPREPRTRPGPSQATARGPASCAENVLTERRIWRAWRALTAPGLGSKVLRPIRFCSKLVPPLGLCKSVVWRLITRRSQVQILPPLPSPAAARPGGSPTSPEADKSIASSTPTWTRRTARSPST